MFFESNLRTLDHEFRPATFEAPSPLPPALNPFHTYPTVLNFPALIRCLIDGRYGISGYRSTSSSSIPLSTFTFGTVSTSLSSRCHDSNGLSSTSQHLSNSRRRYSSSQRSCGATDRTDAINARSPPVSKMCFSIATKTKQSWKVLPLRPRTSFSSRTCPSASASFVLCG